MVTIDKYRGEFGNQLFQAVYAVILADMTEQGYSIPPVDGIKINTYSPDRYPVKGNCVVDDKNCELIYSSMERVNYQVTGFCQNVRFAMENIGLVRRFLSSAIITLEICENAIVVHVRRGDFSHGNNILSFDYYSCAIDRLGKQNPIHVIGRGVDIDCKRFFARYARVRYIANDPVVDWNYLRCSKRCIISNSTFGIWAVMLGHQDRVIIPTPNSGYFSAGHEHQRMYIETDRIEYINCEVL